MQVLIAEDDPSVSSALEQVMQRSGYGTAVVRRGSDVLLQHREADVILLDRRLLDGDAFDSLRKLRQVSEVPVVMVTAQGDERSTVQALHLGADDYVVKPVRRGELLARIDAVLRRRAVRPEQQQIRGRGFAVDLAARTVTADSGEVIGLTTKQFELLATLARRAGAAVSREQILDEVWGDAYAAQSRSFDVHLTQLRAKLPTAGAITTVRGFGYRLEAD